MRIVHFSDWHGGAFDLPPADLYACTGDMLPNFRIYDIDLQGGGRTVWEHNLELLGEPLVPQPPGTFVKRPPDPARERDLQARYLKKMGHGYMRQRFGTPDAPVACCRGNHDFTELWPMFGGRVFEIGDDPTLWSRFGTLKIGGVRGMRKHRGRWSDELSDPDFADRARGLPQDLDVLVTHSPPEGILDFMSDGHGHVGSPALRTYVERHDPALTALTAHLFGHIHEAHGLTRLGGTLFSNAATTWNVIDL